jgi:hypothetical protein
LICKVFRNIRCVFQKINQILNNSWYNNPRVGGGLGWFYYPYHKNINKTLILQNFYDDFWKELQMGDRFCEEWLSHSKLYAKFCVLFCFCRRCGWITSFRKSSDIFHASTTRIGKKPKH